MSQDDSQSKKDDLSDIFSLEDPIAPTDPGVTPTDASSAFPTTAQETSSEKPIEGFTGLIAPAAEPLPTGLETSVGDDPLANLPPIDADLIATATGGNTSASFAGAEDSPSGTNPGIGAERASTLDDLEMPAPEYQSAPLSSESGEELRSKVTLPQAPEPDLDALESTALLEKPAPVVAAVQNSMKQYSEKVSPAPALHVPAGIPYSLLIEGRLRVHERERLTQIATRDLGLREVELEPQFEAGKILIPRISEYAGVMLVQALRGAHVKMRLGPSDRIFSSKDSRDDDALILPTEPMQFSTTESGQSPADLIPLTPDGHLAGKKNFTIVDTLHASMNVKAAHIHSPTSSVFQEAIDALKRQLKFRAHHKGATAIIHFSTQMFPIADQTQYKLVAQGTAVKAQS